MIIHATSWPACPGGLGQGKLTPTMSTSDVQDTLLIALAKTGLDHVLVEHRPRLLSDNGSCFVSKDLKHFLDTDISNTPGAQLTTP